jgi:hypothetical protein
MDIPDINTREELRAFIAGIDPKELDRIRDDFLEGFADGYRIDQANANEAYVGFLEGCMLDCYEEIYDTLGGYEAGLECGTSYRECMDGQD